MKSILRLVLSVAAVGAIALPTAAFAGPPHRAPTRGYHTPRPPPPPVPHARGRYELVTHDRWVEGYYVKDWVPERCHEVRRRGPRHKRMRCDPGYYTDRWVPGHYEKVQEWVWVPAHRRGWQVSVYR